MTTKLPINLEALLRQRTVEGERIEYKTGWKQRPSWSLAIPGRKPMTTKLPINLEDLRIGKAISRRYRNRRIGEFLKELDLTEGRSTGIPKILKIMSINRSPEPEFETDEDRTYFLIRLPIHKNAAQELASKGDNQVPHKYPSSTPQVKNLLNAVQGEMRREELMQNLGLRDRKHFAHEYLQPALYYNDLIEMTIPDKPQSSKQRYRLTDKGRQRVQEAAE